MEHVSFKFDSPLFKKKELIIDPQRDGVAVLRCIVRTRYKTITAGLRSYVPQISVIPFRSGRKIMRQSGFYC